MDTKNTMSIWDQPLPEQLLAALFSLAGSNAFPKFLRDILTEKEISEIAARFEAARLLAAGATYVVIQEQTNLSTRTIARISTWLKQGAGGYGAALENMNKQDSTHSHILPVRAE